MRYIFVQDKCQYPKPLRNQPLQFSSHRACRNKYGWLIVSPDTKGWCTLNDEEYAVFQELTMQSSPIIGNESGTKEHDGFIAALIQCRLVEPVCGGINTRPNIDNHSSPFHLTLILSAHCNLSCRYCYLGMDTTVQRSYLNVTVAREAIRNVFTVPHKHITIDFGEIDLSFPLFRELVLFTKTLQRESPEKVVILAIQTNGTSLKPSVLDFLEHHKVFVGISLDGPHWLHNQIRVSPSGQGSHLRAQRGLQEIIEREMEHIVLCTISSANVKHPETLIDYFIRLGVSHFALKPVIKRGTALDKWQVVGISSDEYKEFLRHVVNYAIERRTWKALDVNLIHNLFRLMGDPRGWVGRCPGSRCGAGLDMLVVNPYGDFYPCPRLTCLKRNPLFLGVTFDDAIQAVNHLAPRITSKQCAECIWSAYCEEGCRLQFKEPCETADDFTCSIQQHVYDLLMEKLISATYLINAVSGAGPGQFKLFHRDFFSPCSTKSQVS